jgi:hypothetical protein
MGAGRSLLKPLSTTWHMQMGAAVTAALNPSQHALGGGPRAPRLVRKSAHGVAIPDSGV